jgi:hypothetical protein
MAVAVAAALIPAAALATTASGAAAGQAATPKCSTAGLVVWMDTNGNGAAGSIFYTLKFTNLSGHACTLSGHPGVIAVSLNGARIDHAARWDPPAPSLVRLANGATAIAVLQYSDVITSNNHCTAAAAGLRVRTPDRVQGDPVPVHRLREPHAGLSGGPAGEGKLSTACLLALSSWLRHPAGRAQTHSGMAG